MDEPTFYKFEMGWDGDPAVPPTRKQLAQALRRAASDIAKGDDWGTTERATGQGAWQASRCDGSFPP